MALLVSGAGGFIGFHTCLKLLERGESVIGVDNLNDYYTPQLKLDRLKKLRAFESFIFYHADIADRDVMREVGNKHLDITRIIHLAAQAGVRYSLENPFAYTHSNIEGQLVMLELARNLSRCEHFVYASSSSVYGSNTELPFSTGQRVDHPISLYAATKKSGELMAHCYSHLYGFPTTGLRFFTVYGPWGRPDMAAFLFVKAIIECKPIRVYNNGNMRRDFTYIDDIVQGVIAVTDKPPHGAGVPCKIYNIGNNRSENLMRFISVIENSLGRKAEIIFEPLQPGDVLDTFADTEDLQRDFGFKPSTSIEEGIPRFVSWFHSYYNK